MLRSRHLDKLMLLMSQIGSVDTFSSIVITILVFRLLTRPLILAVIAGILGLWILLLVDLRDEHARVLCDVRIVLLDCQRSRRTLVALGVFHLRPVCFSHYAWVL